MGQGGHEGSGEASVAVGGGGGDEVGDGAGVEDGHAAGGGDFAVPADPGGDNGWVTEISRLYGAGTGYDA